VAIDGKRLRGSATAQSPGTHLLAAFSAGLQGVIGQLRVAPEANEITAALELLKTLPLHGVTITGDAIFTQKAICQVIIEGGGDYFFTVKGNQPDRQGQSACLEIRHRTGLPAAFPPRRYGRRRLTSGAPKRSRKATAGSRRDRLRRPRL
jgi:Transposase DDE domain